MAAVVWALTAHFVPFTVSRFCPSTVNFIVPTVSWFDKGAAVALPFLLSWLFITVSLTSTLLAYFPFFNQRLSADAFAIITLTCFPWYAGNAAVFWPFFKVT